MHLDKLNVSNTYVNGEHYTGTSAVQGGALALSGNYCNITNSVFTNCSVVYYKDDSNASGGALYIWGNHTNIVNCNFTNNTASEDGGAIYIEGKDCTLNNTVFIGNVAHNDGGAIEWNGDNGRVYNLTAIGNYADSDEGYLYGNASEGSSKGGTLVLSGNNMVLEKLNITNSRVFASHYNGDKPLQGGAVFLTGNNCNISDSTFHNCSVNYNKGKSYGGAMYIIGNNANLSNCNFTKNTAVLGAGAIYIEGSNTFMDNGNVLNNSAKDGAGIWISGKENTINNTNISYNKASGNGGGVYYQGNNNTVSYSNIDHNTANNGANVYMINNMVGGKLIGCNITNGRASNFGGGVEWLQGSKECLIKDCYFYNDTSGGHGGGVHWYPGTNGQIDNCTFETCHVDKEKNGGAIYAGATGGTQASGTIISNSKFINCTSGSRGVLTWIGNNGLIVNNTFIDCGKSSGSTNYGGVQAIQIQNGKNNQIIGCNFTNCSGTLGGGAIRLQGDNGNVDNITIANCNFENCTAQESAGAIYMNSPVRNVKLENNTFTGNHAPNYGALFIDDAATISSFVNNNFTNNSATASDGNGGAARLNANINVVNSTFTANSCNGSGGAIYTASNLEVSGSTFENNTAKYGGAIATENSNLVVDQSIFKYNKAESGSAINAATIDMSNTELLENQASFDKWENENYLFADDHLTVSGTFVGKDNLLNGIKANSGTFNNVTYCGVNGGGVGEGTTNTDDVLSANSYNEVHQIVVMEVYDVNGELKYNLTNYTDEDGNYKFDLSLDGAVVSFVKVYHPEDNYYTGAEYEIVRVPSELNINCENIYVDEVENITFKVIGSRDTPTGNITVLINDTYGNVIFNGTIPLNGSGEANITLSGLNASQYYIYASYNGDNDYLPDDETAQFNVSKWNSTVEVVPVPSIIYGSLEDINITVSSDGTSGNFTGNLIINITSEDAIGFENISQIIELIVDDEGKVIDWTINNMILPVGNYNITVVYSGNYKYNGNSSQAKFTVNKADSAVTVNLTNITYGEDEIIKYNVTDGATGTVNITVTGADGVVETFNDVPIENGTIGVNVADLPAGNYSVNVTYNGDNNFNPSSTVANFSVDKATPTVNVNTTDIDYNTTEPVKVNVTGVEGGEVPTGNVTVIVRNASGVVVTFNEVPIENGVVTVPVENLPAGDYDVDVTYNGDDNYDEASFTGSFSVGMIDSSVTVDPVNITYGEDEVIKYNVTDGATGNVTITITGDALDEPIVLPEVPIVNGTVGVVVSDLLGGNYTVNITYNGDNNFNPSSAVANFSVGKATPSVNVNTTDIDYNTTEDIKVNVTGVDGGAVPTGNVTVIVRNSSGGAVFNYTVPIENGVVTVPVEDLPAGDYYVNVIYNGDENYAEASFTGGFTVNKINPTVEVNTSDIVYGDTENINITLPEDATGTVNVTVKGPEGFEKTFTDLPVEDDGTVTVPVEDLNAGDYTVDVSYSGDNNYNPQKGTGSFSVDKSTPSVSVEGTNIDYGESETITVNVTGKNITGNVTIIIDGHEYDPIDLTQTEDGATAVLNIPGLSGGEHTVKAVYNGDENHYSNESEDQFEVSKVKPSIDVKPTDIDYGQDEDISITLTGVEGGSAPTGNVTVIVRNSSGDVVFNDTVDLSDGKITVSVEDLPSGDYNVTVTYNGDKNYTSIEDKKQFSVGKFAPTVSVNTSDIDYHDSESIKVNVTGVDGDIPTGNVTVVVTNETGGVVYNKTYNLTNGAVTVPVDDLVAGKYNVTVSYNGDDNYRHADGNANFTVNKIAPSILVNASDIDYHDSETINVTVNDDATGTVSITVTNEDGDVVYSNSSELSGSKASFTVPDLSAGKYNVTVEYSGDNNYNAETGKTNFIVNKIDTPVNLETENIIYGEEETIRVSVNDNATGSLTITIYSKDGTPVYSETVPIDDASAQITVPELNAGNYTVHVDYSGDGNYKPSSADGKFEVAKADAIVEIHVYDIIYGEIEELTVTCNAPGTVTIYVNGASVTLPLENGYGHILFASWLSPYSGKAQWDLENLAAGTYPARVHYNGNENYNEAENEDVFNVLKKETSVSVSVDDIKVGEDAVINVELSPSAAPGKLTITVDGKEYTVTPKNGKASLKVPGLKAGNHTVTVSYPGSENYTDSSNETIFTVSKVKPDIDVSAPTIKVGEDGKITVTLPKDATGKVTIEIDGKNYTSQIKDGKAVFTVSGLKVGKHSIKIFYTGDDKYESSVVDGGFIKVIDDNNHGSNDHKGHANGIDLSTKATGNPVLALLFVLVFLGIIPLRRKKDEEDED